MIGLLVTSREFTEIISNTAESWNKTGPPADIEYAEEPIGVDTIIPSLLSCHTSSPLTLSVCSINIALFEGNTATSLSTG